jgi:cytosine permease
VPHVEGHGLEPIPAGERTVAWVDLFAINFTFFLNPVMMVLGALAVLEGDLPVLWAVVAAIVGQIVAYVALSIVAEPGVDHGLPGQVAMRAPFGVLGARALTSPYRVIASTYWFAAQALTAGFGIQALADELWGVRPPLVPTALALATVHATLAVLGFDVMRWLLRVVLPLSLASAVVLGVLWAVADDPRYAAELVFWTPAQDVTWTGFAAFVTVMCGSSLTLVTSIADICRYTRSRRDVRLGLIPSAVAATALTTLIGGAFAASSGEANPFVAAADVAGSDLVLAVLLVSIVVQTFAANLTNAYTAGLSLVNTAPGLGRVRATIIVGAAGVTLAAFPTVIEEAQSWVTHLGNLAAPITGVVLADYLWARRRRLDAPSLYASPAGLRAGISVAALAGVAAGTVAYSLLPDAGLKVVWGAAAAALGYVAAPHVPLGQHRD